MPGAAIGREHRLQLRDFRAADELAVIEHTLGCDIDRTAEPAALGCDIDEGDGFWTHVLVHGALWSLDRDQSAGDAARSFARGGGRGPGRQFETADRNFEAGDALLAGHRGRWPVRTASRKANVRRAAARHSRPTGGAWKAAVRLEAEALRHLERQQIAHDTFVARRDSDGARLGRVTSWC